MGIVISSKQRCFDKSFRQWAKYHSQLSHVSDVYVNFDIYPSSSEIEWLENLGTNFQIFDNRDVNQLTEPLTSKIITYMASVYDATREDNFVISLDSDEFLYSKSDFQLKMLEKFSKFFGGVSIKTLEACSVSNEEVIVKRRNYLSRGLLVYWCPHLHKISNLGYFGHTVGKCLYYKGKNDVFLIKPSAHHTNGSWMGRVVGELFSVYIIHYDHIDPNDFYNKLVSRQNNLKHANLGAKRKCQIEYFLNGDFERKYKSLYKNILERPLLSRIVTRKIHDLPT